MTKETLVINNIWVSNNTTMSFFIDENDIPYYIKDNIKNKTVCVIPHFGGHRVRCVTLITTQNEYKEQVLTINYSGLNADGVYTSSKKYLLIPIENELTFSYDELSPLEVVTF